MWDPASPFTHLIVKLISLDLGSTEIESILPYKHPYLLGHKPPILRLVGPGGMDTCQWPALRVPSHGEIHRTIRGVQSQGLLHMVRRAEIHSIARERL